MRYLPLIVGFLLCSIAWSANQTPNAQKPAASEQSQPETANEKSLSSNPSVDKPPISIVVSPTISGQVHGDDDGNGVKKSPPDLIGIIDGVITGIATLIIAIFTFKLSDSTKRLWQESIASGSTARDAANAMGTVAAAMATNVELLKSTVQTNKEIAARQKLTTTLQLRANVFPTGIFVLYSQAKESPLFEWQLKVVWTNFGSTSTRRLTICTTGEVRDSPLNDSYNFPYDEDHITKGGVLLPHTPLNSASLPWNARITVEDVEAIQAGKKILYIWGWARYNDVFDDTPQHVTKFCWIVNVLGNPRAFIPHSTDRLHHLEFKYSMWKFGNCADEECEH